MDISRIRAVVFDCDGVMFDTAMANRKYYDEVLEHFGKPPLDDEQFKQVHMMTVKDAIAYLFPEKKDPVPVYRYLQGVGYAKFIRFMVMEKGLRQLLDRLEHNGYIRAVATNRTNTMEKVIKDFGLGTCFDEVMTAAMVKNPKPDPEQLLRIMEKFDLEPDEILFIGDSDYDRQAAHRAGTVFAAFKNSALEADFNVDSMDEIGVILGLN